MASREVSTSTIGVGRDYNEELLSAMAQAGAGNYDYVDSPVQLTDVFQTELSGLMSTTGRHVELWLHLAPGVSLAGVLSEVGTRAGRTDPAAGSCVRDADLGPDPPRGRTSSRAGRTLPVPAHMGCDRFPRWCTRTDRSCPQPRFRLEAGLGANHCRFDRTRSLRPRHVDQDGGMKCTVRYQKRPGGKGRIPARPAQSSGQNNLGLESSPKRNSRCSRSWSRDWVRGDYVSSSKLAHLYSYLGERSRAPGRIGGRHPLVTRRRRREKSSLRRPQKEAGKRSSVCRPRVSKRPQDSVLATAPPSIAVIGELREQPEHLQVEPDRVTIRPKTSNHSM